MKLFFRRVSPHLKKLLFLPPILFGCAAVYWATQLRKPPERVPEQELARVLRVVTVEKMPVVLRATGYGTAKHAREWTSIAEVKGRIVELNPELDAGSFIKADDLLVRIDTTDTKLAIDRLDAEIRASRANLAELRAQKANYEESLKIERQALAISEAELNREEKLVVQGAGSTADVDSRKRNVISARQSVQNIQSNLNLLPSQIASAEANVEVALSNLAERNRDLDRCEVRAPFACRLGPVDLEVGEYVAVGQQLLLAYGTEKIEVEAQFPIAQVHQLVKQQATEKRQDRPDSLPQEILRRIFNFEAWVEYGRSGMMVRRPAKFERLREELDAQTRTAGIVVSISDPFKSDSLDGPPPSSGMFCEVELRTRQENLGIAIPRVSLHVDHVYVIDGENRLRKRPVVAQTEQSGFVLLSKGLEPSDQLVVSDPTPAIEGMLVSPVVDTSLAEKLRRVATGARGQ